MKLRPKIKSLTRPLSWMSQVNLIKMSILPKIMYTFQILPIHIPQTFSAPSLPLFLKKKSHIRNLKTSSGMGKKRVAFSILNSNKIVGAMGLPEVKKIPLRLTTRPNETLVFLFGG